jgi:hypothetical protein
MSDADSGHGPYDQVTVSDGNGGLRRLSRAQFEALPLDERVRSILQKRLKFYRQGSEIPVGEALKNH